MTLLDVENTTTALVGLLGLGTAVFFPVSASATADRWLALREGPAFLVGCDLLPPVWLAS